MRSQEDQSSIANENIIEINPEPLSKYISYNEIAKLESTSKHINSHDNCHPFYVKWDKNEQKQQYKLKKSQINNTTIFLVEQPVRLCCYNLKISLDFSMKRLGWLQILKVKIDQNEESGFEEIGVKYLILHSTSTFKIQSLITNEKVTKIWKQIQIPIKNYQIQIRNTLTILERRDGDIDLFFNQYQFMMRFKLTHQEGGLLSIRGDSKINNFSIEHLKDIEQTNQSCSGGKCSIF